MFKPIRHISDIQSAVANKRDISFVTHTNGASIGCYATLYDETTFDSPESLECRGIAFDRHGCVASRPLHKFFNLGERPGLDVGELLARQGEIVGIYEKVDGSMIATAWLDGALHWRSKKAFDSEAVKLAQTYLAQPENAGLLSFSTRVASRGMTAVFELVHPDAPVVIAHDKPAMTLLHVRDNHSGRYVLLDAAHEIHRWVAEFSVPQLRNMADLGVSGALASLETMEGQEGYVIQLVNGNMVKVKCPWYLHHHHHATTLSERDVASLALEGKLDDIKAALVNAGADLSAVQAIEARLKQALGGLLDHVDAILAQDAGLERKDFALKYRSHALFSLLMARYQGREVPLAEWYGRYGLKDGFGQRIVIRHDALPQVLAG